MFQTKICIHQFRDMPPPKLDDTPTITQPPLLEEDKTWMERLNEFFDHQKISEEQLAKQRADGLFGSAMRGTPGELRAAHMQDAMSDEQANRLFGSDTPPVAKHGDARDNEVGYVNSLMRMFGGANTGEKAPVHPPPQPVPGMMVKQNEVAIPPVFNVLIDESMTYRTNN